MPVARVEPLTTARALRGPFDYLIPEGFEEVTPGTLLRIPFGRRTITGLVVEVAESSEIEPERLAEPQAILEGGTTPELVDLGFWLADEYCTTPARGLALGLPPGTGLGRRVGRSRKEKVNRITPLGHQALTDGTRLGPKQRRILELLADGEMTGRAIASAAGGDGASLRRLEERGLIEREERTVQRIPEQRPVGSAAAESPDLNAAQQSAVDRVTAALDRGEATELLLAGVTGSGKTEVYLSAVAEALARGYTAIVLVPEIGLTPQAVTRFKARLGDRVAVLHSGLSAGQRFDEWQRLRTGDALVCVGPRSAIFAPLENLGLIVIDEEHDPSYKQETDPRYDAREVARRRVETNHAVLLCGSATPRPESWHLLDRLELPERVDGSPLPPVELLDMRQVDPRAGSLHPATLEALALVRERGEKAIVMINRRGFAPWLTCQGCGHHWGCPNCDVSLIVHRESNTLVCHHCAFEAELPDACPECGGTTLSQSGVGTERVEQELTSLMDPMPVFRLDADSVARAGGHGEILSRFEQADTGILVGTQMVAKGHDFPAVTLSVILDADATLRFPDFRAEERTFSLVTQLAGRSGRGRSGGTVMVQTLAPNASSISFAAEHDSAGFLEAELERRRVLGYPPFSDLIRIFLSGEDEELLDGRATMVAQRIVEALPEEATVLGPAPMFRARGLFRRRILVKTTVREASVRAVRDTLEAIVQDRGLDGVRLSVDVDPQ